MNTYAETKHDRAEAAASSMIRELEVRLPKTLCLEVHHNQYWNADRDVMPKQNWTWAIKAVGNDEVLGLIKLEREGNSYYNFSPNKYVLTSVRIPQRGSYKRSEGGSRRYKNVTGLIKGVKEFCKVTTNHEAELEKVRERLAEVTRVRRFGKQYFAYNTPGEKRQNRWLGKGSGMPCNDRAVKLLASDVASERFEGQAMLNDCVAVQRAQDRWNRRLDKIANPLWERKWELERIIEEK